MILFETLASWTYAVVDLIAFEILLATIFIVQDGRVKLTIDYLFGGISSYKKTAYYVFPALILGILYFYTSNFIQDYVINILASTGWKTIPSFLCAVSFACFWITKVNLGREWDFKLVFGSIAGVFISLILIFL